jgi:SAM-dependent methyltransferase
VTDSIYERPEQYDLEHQGDDADVQFYLDLARKLRPGRVLELACGSGRVTLPLAELGATQGFDVVGLETSPEMLGQAKTKAASLPGPVQDRLRLVQGDMRSWRDGDGFDLIVVPCASLAHMLSLDDQLSTWRTAHANLVAGGRFVADVPMPDLATLAQSMQTPPRALLELDIDNAAPETGERLIRFKATTYLPHEQRARIHFLYDRFEAQAPAERTVSDFESHVYFPRELALLFLCAGFVVEATFGDYRFGRLRAGSAQIIVVGRKT